MTIEEPALEGKRVLLVGGAGFIGHNLALHLRRLGAEVAVIDSLQVNNLLSLHDRPSAPPERDLYRQMIDQRLDLLQAAGVPVLLDDARDYHRLSKRFSEFEPNVVVLLAAVSHASRANKDPMATLDHSFRSLENALDNSRGHDVHFVFLSSSMVYGNFSGSSVDELAPCSPLGIYGAVKLGGEKLVVAYSQVFDSPYTIIRPSALYGERCISRRVGQVFIENAIRGHDLVIQGDGSDRLDFTYIQDFVSGVGLVIGREEAKNQIFNMTYGAGRTIESLAELVQGRYTGVGVRHTERSGLMPERGTLDISKARSLIGYAPQYPIELGFVRYMDWYDSMNVLETHASLTDVVAQTNE